MATLMVRQKVDLEIVQRALRLSRHSTTADLYAHVLDDMQRAGPTNWRRRSANWGSVGERRCYTRCHITPPETTQRPYPGG